MGELAKFGAGEASATETEVERTLVALDEAQQARVLTLVRGVPHSARARAEFNEFALGLGVDPNAILAYLRDFGELRPATTLAETDGQTGTVPLSEELRVCLQTRHIDEESGFDGVTQITSQRFAPQERRGLRRQLLLSCGLADPDAPSIECRGFERTAHEPLNSTDAEVDAT